MNRILIVGGCGFVGANLALYLKSTDMATSIIVYDNLMRAGSELNQRLLKENDIVCLKGDTRDREALAALPPMDVIIDAAAEPSVLAGLKEATIDLLDINLGGTINCLELARKWKSAFIFLSTSRIYPYQELNRLPFVEQDTRFDFADQHQGRGINEQFGYDGAKSFYGASKLASEQIIAEYHTHYHLPTIINRFGVIGGPLQMGKVDQGIIALWVAHHFYGHPLSYLGFGGEGKQVRDILHIHDVCRLIKLQLENLETLKGRYFNVGGGFKNTVSLKELTGLVTRIVGRKIDLDSSMITRPADVRIYYTDNQKLMTSLDWTPEKTVSDCVQDTYDWIKMHETTLAKIFKR